MTESKKRMALEGYGEHHDHRHVHFFNKNTEEEDFIAGH